MENKKKNNSKAVKPESSLEERWKFESAIGIITSGPTESKKPSKKGK